MCMNWVNAERIGKRLFILVAATVACIALPLGANAQEYPSKPIRLIIGFPPGGITDLLARVLAQGLQENLGQNALVENRPGGNFVIAADAAAKSDPDGHTLLMAIDSTFTITPLIVKTLPFDPDRDFAPISLTALQTPFIVASGKAPAKTMKEMLVYAKANPGKVSWGSSALITQLIGEHVRLLADVNMQHIPFKGSPPMLQALLSGDIHYAVTTFTPYVTYTKDGRLVGLAVTGEKRESLVPDVPTLAELGLGGATSYTWYGLFAPAKTPTSVLQRLQAETARVLSAPANRKRLLDAGIEPVTSTPAELGNRIQDDRAKWKKLVKAAGIKVQ
jgi:tripartite-type tricarboxylate transporter receptor subunit TctC